MRKIIFLLSLCSCTSSFIDEPIYSVPDEIQPYYDSFIRDGKKHGIDFSHTNVVISFTEHPGDEYGLACIRDDHISRITIDKSLFQSINSRGDTTRLKYILYHEFGHSFLRRLHVDNCNSIMYAFHGCSWKSFQFNETEMIEELFTNR